MIANLSRRGFLKGLVGAGAFMLGARSFLPEKASAQETPAETFRPSLFLAIDAAGVVTIVAHRSEMGTGIRTCLPAVLADELEADWTRVRIEQAVGDEAYGSQNTDGSRSIRDFYQPMREIGASARAMLEAAAAKTWGVPPSECRAELHRVVHAGSGKSAGFGELVGAAAKLEAPAKETLRFKEPAERRYVGKGFKIYDAAGIVQGQATFGLDARLPGMKYATIARSPVLGGLLEAHDPAAAKAVAGVEEVVALPNFQAPHAFQALGGMAVVAGNTWAAIQGRKALERTLKWAAGPNEIYDSKPFRDALLKAATEPGTPVRTAGKVDEALAAAATTHQANYTSPLLAHASMEPPCAVAQVTEAGCEVWAPTQNPQAARDTLAATLGIPKEKVTVHVTLLGGGFGRKSKPDYVAEAALVSKAIGAPVQVVWTREDDIRHDYYHAPAAVHLRAGLDGEGKVTAWLQRSAFSSISSTFVPGSTTPMPLEMMLGFVDLPFAIPNLRCEHGSAPSHLRIGWLRSVCNIFHAFAIGSFADELAAETKTDPAEFLIQLLGPDRLVELGEGVTYPNYGRELADYPIDTARLRGVIERVREESGWGRELPAGHGLGIAAHRSFHAYVAAVVEVAVDEKGRILVPRVDIAADLGTVINPDRVVAQMEGSVVFGLSLALKGKISASRGAVQQSNFHDYQVLRIHECPPVLQVHLVDSDALPGGAGEPGVPPIAPALANAIFAATGKRLRDLPLKL